jgi:hypothetical protein
MNQNIRYRVYDHRGNYQQSYSNELSGGFGWAKDCAKRTIGYVVEHVLKDGKEVSSEVIFDVRNK